MRTKLFDFLLLAALAFGLGWSVTSCSDDDDEKSEEQKQEEAHEKAVKFWDIVGQLVSVDDVSDDYTGKTFEPTYGMPDGNDETTRIVNTNDMKTAAQRFANLVGAKDINEETPSYTWSDPDVGSMTYTRGGTAAQWATVDVDIKAVPHLQKIIYRAGTEGDNGKFAGRAYYRFGDVVSRQVDVTFDQKKNNDSRGTITEYWICVRPSFGPEGKEDSHWVCVNTVGDNNYKYYKASTGKEYWLPTSLKTDKENMQNFAELLWAICYPEQWEDNINYHHKDGALWGFSGVPFFTDFKGANIKYHNKYFWQNVQNGWDKAQVAEKALNLPNLGFLIDRIKTNGVHLLYNGYSWWFTTSWNCQLWEAVYTNGTKDEELNMHHAVYNEKVERNMKDLKFDVRAMGKDTANYRGFFNNDNNYRWAIRHATGKELAANKKYDVKQPINGVTEVYRYYRDVVPTNDLAVDPEVTQDKTITTNGFFYPGVFIQDEEGTRWMCIDSWIDDPAIAKSTAHYAHFISFDGLTSKTENIGNKTGQFIGNADLVPENQAFIVAAILQFMSNSKGDWGGASVVHKDIKAKFNEYYGRTISSWEMTRDTIFSYEAVSGQGYLKPLSIFYMPSAGRTAGTQPYFRFVLDGSHVGPVRTSLPEFLRYPYAQCFKKYNDGSGQTLDATHLFTCSDYITEAKPVKADKWSICVNTATQMREGDFKASDRYTDDFDWRLFQDKGYKSAYHEPIIAVRYLALLDNSATFLGTYQGKKYTLLYEPTAGMDMMLRFGNVTTLANYHNGIFKKYNYVNNGCYMDNVLYDPNIFTWASLWDE